MIGSTYQEDIIIIKLYVSNKIFCIYKMYDGTTWVHW